MAAQPQMEFVQQYWPLALGAISVIVWLVRLESRIFGNSKEIKRLGEQRSDDLRAAEEKRADDLRAVKEARDRTDAKLDRMDDKLDRAFAEVRSDIKNLIGRGAK